MYDKFKLLCNIQQCLFDFNIKDILINNCFNKYIDFICKDPNLQINTIQQNLLSIINNNIINYLQNFNITYEIQYILNLYDFKPTKQNLFEFIKNKENNYIYLLHIHDITNLLYFAYYNNKKNMIEIKEDFETKIKIDDILIFYQDLNQNVKIQIRNKWTNNLTTLSKFYKSILQTYYNTFYDKSIVVDTIELHTIILNDLFFKIINDIQIIIDVILNILTILYIENEDYLILCELTAKLFNHLLNKNLNIQTINQLKNNLISNIINFIFKYNTVDIFYSSYFLQFICNNNIFILNLFLSLFNKSFNINQLNQLKKVHINTNFIETYYFPKEKNKLINITTNNSDSDQFISDSDQFISAYDLDEKINVIESPIQSPTKNKSILKKRLKSYN